MDKKMQNASAVMQGLLYGNPLYRWIMEGEKNINVMVIGYDAFAEKFIDLCLQAGQMKGHALYLTVVTKEPGKAREEYLKNRPALSSFVNVDGSLADCADAYAVLDFIAIPGEEHAFCKSRMEENRRIVEEIMLTSLGKERVHYLFLSLGEDAFNRRLAELFAETARVLENRCCVNYIQESCPDETKPGGDAWCRPVSVTGGLRVQPGGSELEQMAFHTHLLWKGMENIDMQKAWEEFLQPYYYEASMSYALSIGSKLNSFGITGGNADEIAETFDRQVLQQRGRQDGYGQIFDQMTVLEHRRWVLEKAVNGWQAPLSVNGEMDLSYCVELGDIKDLQRKYHPCMVRSTSSAPLKSGAYTKNRFENWDHPGSDEENLDDLDRVSLALHRCFYQYTLKFRQTHPMESGDVEQVGRLVQDAADDVQQAYRRYCLCLRNILDGEAGYSRQYDDYEKKFLLAAAAAVSLEDTKKQSIQEGVRRIRRCFFPVIEYTLYRNYKELDEELLEKLPFILTYRRDCHLAAALNLAPDRYGESDAVFQNVASATVIHPGQMTYLYCVDLASDFGLLRRKLISISNYFHHRNITCRIHLRIFLLERASEREKALNGMLKKLQKQIALDVNIERCEDEYGAANRAVQMLQENQADVFDGTNALFASNRQNSFFVQKLTKQLPYFEFDRTKKCFKNDSRCGHLHYLADKSYMRVEDMFAMMNAKDRQYHYPDFAEEYETLWKIYTGTSTRRPFQRAVGCWNNLCGQLDEYGKTHVGAECMSVRNLSLVTGTYRMADYLDILEALHQKGYIRKLSSDQRTVSFQYPSGKWKDLLTKAGEILEIYTYFEACKTGYFDDVVSGYEFRWETGGVTNELDCVLTKGFRSIIVECKAQMELKQDFYYKLDSLAGRFGIGTKKVLIANTYVDSPRFNRVNDLQRTRGNQMDIITVSAEDDIQNIGKVLQKIMEENI